ncbi:MAG: zinc ribbon domain-containing protein [Crocinitomicaceae bacterium]|nr:zinc ribbon domain-containing protein [Crocinitomicaceae bacterium]
MEEKKTCPQCRHRNNHSANYCENYGSKVTDVVKGNHQGGIPGVLDEFTASAKSKTNQSLILVGLLVLCSTTIYYFILGVVVDISDNWELYQTVKPFSLVVSFLGIGAALVIALGMTRGSQKTVAIIFASIYALIQLYWFMDFFLPEEEPFQYLQF